MTQPKYIKLVVDEKAFYMREDVFKVMCAETEINDFRSNMFMRNSDFVVDITKNEIIKCRVDFEYVMDKFVLIR